MRERFLLFNLVGLLALSGCAYSLGPTNGQISGAKSIQVNPLINDTIEPRLSEPVTLAVRKGIQRDGTFRLDTRGEGDIIVAGTITKFDQQTVSLQPADSITPLDYHVSITARITARDRATGKVLVDRDVTGYSTVRVVSDLPSAEREAVPMIADNLGRRVASILSEGAW